MIKVENSFDSTLIDMENIMIHSWQHSTMEEQINVSNNFILITISPSQFRSLLSSSSNSNSFARYILRYVLQKFPLSQQILVLIADQIQKYNISIFEHKNDECSMKIATSLGQKISSYFIQAYNELSFNDRQKIQIINWTDMLLSSNYDNHVQNIRQYINNNQEQCFPLIDKVCLEYARARCSRKHLKIKEIIKLREYVINELPALLNGIEYYGNSFQFILHPILKTENSNGNNQREAMIILLNHMRENYLINAAHIFDIEILRSLIIINDGSITDSSHSSSTLSNLNDNSTQTLQESMIDIHNHSNYLWLFFIFQLFIFVFYHYWLQICLISFIIYSIYYISMLFIQQISKRGEWYSSLNNNEQKVLGTNYKSLFGDLSSIQSSQNGYFLNDLHNQLGSPQAYRIWMGPEPALMLAHPQAVKDFWGQHNEKCVERNVSLGWPLEMLMGNGVGFRSLPDRNRITKYFHQCFGASQVRHFDTQLELTVSKFFNNYSSEFLQYQNIRYFAHDVSVHLFLGKIGFDYLNELHELVDELGHLMNEAFNGRWTNLPLIGYYLLPSSYPLRKRIRLFNTRTRNVLMKIINIYQQTSMVNNGDDTITNNNISLLEYFAHDLKPTITFDELTDTIIEGLLAPNDGTAGTFMYTLLLLGMHPNIQETARQEIQSLTDLSLKSLSTTTYLDQILSECQRLCPIFMFNVPEFSSKSMIISGIQIPKNTMVMLDVISLNHNQDTWSDPLTFRPERFMTPVLPATLKAYHGFGNGHIRRCLGQYVIKNLHRLFLAHLLNQKQILLIDQIKNIHDIKRCRLPFIYIPTQSVRLVQL